MHLPLKEYQERTLETLTEYYQNCLRLQNANTAFYDITDRPYAAVKGLPGMPYVCLRLPTGGGKTFVACHAVSITASELLKTESPLVLWLTPSNAIRDQTLNALKEPDHPYRDAFRSAGHNVDIRTIGDALHLQPHILNTKTTIIVSTMQAFRVEDTEGRKVYEDSGALMGHFTHLSDDVLSELESDNGKPAYSLANLLCVKRPLVIVDEAHNARTPLSFETLARFNPSAIIEFTATPAMAENRSNVLYKVSAAELQAEDMIKMPIRLETDPDWKQLLTAAIAQRDALEADAEQEREDTSEYIRPIMLIQAQPRRRDQETLTVEVVENCLLEEHGIPEDQIARATGEDKELDDAAYQNFLLPDFATPVVVSPDHCFSFDPHGYPYNTRYDGAYRFQKHYYRDIGDLKSDGEEFQCAQFIDTLPQVKYWVRNLERKPLHSFWLQTATDKFYPDFVCLLTDGRYLIVEYKGDHLWSADDAREKSEIGELWEKRSEGKCLFIMPKGPDFDAIRAKLSQNLD